jgi:quercetin dioxygenase-like cupin family protein
MEILDKQPTVKGPAEWFTGDVYFDVIAPAVAPSRGKVNLVRFSPGARTAWHRHANGQTLCVTEGTCWTQSRGGDVVVARPGDVLWCPPDRWHWHGASPDTFMAHLAMWDGLAEGQTGPETEWGEHVTDAEYHRGSRAAGAPA